MRRIRSLVVVATLLAAITPSATAGRSGTMAPLPQAWRASEPSPFEQLAAARGSWMELAAFEELLAGLIGMGAASTVLPDPEFVFPSRVGDVDGDGRNDVLTAEFAGEQSALAVRSGLDGSLLLGIHDAHAAQPVDLDADGTGELLILGTGREQLASGVDIVQQRITLLTFDDDLWTYEVPGAVLRAADPEGGVAADVEFVVGLSAMPDATGDGVDDVWVATASFGYLDSEVFVEADAVSGRTIDGATGLQVGHVLTAGVNALPWIVTTGDVSGDNLADTFSLTGIDAENGVLSARSTAGVPHWTVQVPTSFAYPSVHELTGDGIPDVMLQAFTPSGAFRLAFSGTDGAPLWSHPDLGYTDAAGDIDGDGGTDIIQIETPSTGVVARAWSGATGETLWGPQTYPAGEGAWVLNCICADDLDGDGIWDPMTAEVYFGDPVTLTIRTLAGTSGLPLWLADADPSATFPVPIGADIDGDGATDLGTAASSGTAITARTLRGADNADLWSVTAPLEGFALGFYGDDLTGDGDPELVLATVRFVEESLRGAAHVLDPAGVIWSVS